MKHYVYSTLPKKCASIYWSIKKQTCFNLLQKCESVPRNNYQFQKRLETTWGNAFKRKEKWPGNRGYFKQLKVVSTVFAFRYLFSFLSGQVFNKKEAKLVKNTMFNIKLIFPLATWHNHGQMLKAPPLIPSTYIYRSFKIDPTEGHYYLSNFWTNLSSIL